ncbi:MAG: hypothetical protein ACJAV6_000508 [Candidatus Paceibacteria bacterium]|jgi:hypothetical protein
MNERETERLIDSLRDINRTLEQKLEKIDRTLEEVKDALQERNN